MARILLVLLFVALAAAPVLSPRLSAPQTEASPMLDPNG